MADEKQRPVPGKVQKDKNNRKKFKVEKGDQPDEVDVEIDVVDDGDYEVEKLQVQGLPTHIDNIRIHWFNNFSVKHKGGDFINQRYKVTIPGLSNRGSSRLVIYDRKGGLYYYQGTIEGDTFELMDGDPSAGQAP
jgi:hypothetical protein